MSVSATVKQPQSSLNIVLWILQVLSGIFWSFTGFGKVLCINPAVWNMMLPNVPWFSAVPRGLFVFIGVCEFLGGVGLILPAMTGVKPKLTAWAALGLTAIMLLAALFHIARGESAFFVPTNLVLGGVAAFVAYGRFIARPLPSTPISAFRTIQGLAVVCGLAIAGFVPVWYQLIHTR